MCDRATPVALFERAFLEARSRPIRSEKEKSGTKTGIQPRKREIEKMTINCETLDIIEALETRGREFMEDEREGRVFIGHQFDVCEFDKWRRNVNDLLYSLEGCEGIYYQRFSKEVTRPHARDLEIGLRVLNAARDDLYSALRKEEPTPSCAVGGPGGQSVSFH